MKMRNFILTALGLIFINAESLAQDGLVRELDSLFNDAIHKGIFSGDVIISKDGKPFYQKRYGYADWQEKREITDSTLYNIGSLTKLFTQEIIYQLIKEGKLNAEDNVHKYLDLFSNDIDERITIEQLLNMRSGLGDYFGSREFRKIEQADFKLDDLLEIIKKQPLLFEPGKGEAYSNSGYIVLGAIIEKVTGKSYKQNLKERVVMPLNLKAIYYSRAEKAAKSERAFGHITDLEGRKISEDDISNAHPDGGIYTTAADLLKFTEAKRRHQTPSKYNYASGLFIGGTPPWNAVALFTADGYTVVILCNQGESADRLGHRLESILKGEHYPALNEPMRPRLYKLLREKGISYIEQHIEQLCQEDGKRYDARFLNMYGHDLLSAGKSALAIELFELNTQLFPEQPSVYDALGDALLETGNKLKAKENYAKVLEIDPRNERVRELLKQLN